MAETSQQGNLYAPPQARVEDISAIGEFELAGRGTRLGAAILDGLMFAGIGIVAAIVIPIFAQKGGDSQLAAGITGVLFAIAFIGILIANCVLLHRNGQTIGKKILGIKVVRSNGERIGLLRIFGLRFLPVALLGAIPIVGTVVSLVDPLLIFRDSRQCLHDNIADTIVIQA